MSLNFKDVIKNQILFIICTPTTISDISNDQNGFMRRTCIIITSMLYLKNFMVFYKNKFLIIFCFLIFSQSVLIRKSCAILVMN